MCFYCIGMWDLQVNALQNIEGNKQTKEKTNNRQSETSVVGRRCKSHISFTGAASNLKEQLQAWFTQQKTFHLVWPDCTSLLLHKVRPSLLLWLSKGNNPVKCVQVGWCAPSLLADCGVRQCLNFSETFLNLADWHFNVKISRQRPLLQDEEAVQQVTC